MVGGCLCGAVRFTVRGAPLSAAWCHCRTCQRWSGAPTVAWATFAPDQVDVLGAVAWVRTSSRAERGHCAACGSRLFFRPLDPRYGLDVTVATFDHPAPLVPTYAIWSVDQLPWTRGVDAHLVRHEGDGPEWT